jgi:Ca2+-binding RTX toxin-like protein
MISSRTVRTMILGMVVLALIGTGAALPLSGAEAADPPGSLLAYFGWPSQINGATTADQAAAEFGRYDFVFLPGTTRSPSTGQLTVGVEDPSHPDHARTKAIIAHPLMANTRVFGYVNLGVANGQLTLPEVRARIDLWRAMGADGIQLDAMGYDWEVTRTRQNNAVDYVHSLGMPVAANAWVPADVFGNEAIPVSNPNGVATRLGEGDYYMFESYWIRLGVPPTPGSADGWTYEYWLAKAQQLAAYQRQLGFGILSVTTNNAADVFSNASFDAAWDKAAEYGHTATGWGEYLFSADDNLAPFRPRPGMQAVCAGQAATIIGTALDDRLVGTEHPDVIAGLGGNDVIEGSGGDDLICGGPGRDVIRGRAGADRLYGNAGPDRLLGQGGNDILIGGKGIDLARGGPGVDTCDAEQTFTCEG